MADRATAGIRAPRPRRSRRSSRAAHSQNHRSLFSCSALPGGSAVTVEPGGQIELSSAPYYSARELCDYLAADQAVLADLLSSRSILMSSEAADTRRPAQRLLQSPRYCAMESRFTGIGPFGKLMMCNTAATQISVDAGADPVAVEKRWHLLRAIGPALIAAFACSPRLYGVPDGQWASQRMRTWLELDSSRTTGTPQLRTTQAGRWMCRCCASATTERLDSAATVQLSRTGSTAQWTT